MAAVIDDVVRAVEASLDADERARGLPRAAAVIERAIDVFTSDPATYKPITLRIPGTLLRHLGERDAARMQVAALEEARRAGVLSAAARPAALGRHVFFAFMGCLYAWACDDIDDDDFRSHALLALHASVLPFLSEAAAPAARREVRRLLSAIKAAPNKP